MNLYTHAIQLICAIMTVLWLTHCAERIAGGGGVETGNPEVAGVIKQGREPAAGVIVTLYPENFNPVSDETPAALRDITDGKGRYLFQAVESGFYNIQAFLPEDRSAALIRSVEVPDADNDTMVAVPEAGLKKPGTLAIHLDELAVEEGGYIYIPGTGINADITREDIINRYLTVDNLPSAAYPVVHYAVPDLSSETILLDEGVKVQPGETAVIGPFNAWPDTAKIVINTSSTGADVADDVLHIPLLVRLTDPILTLSLSKGDGDDLRFSKSDGATPLPYHIERWDPGNGLAEIWVGMDTVYGDNESQFIYIFTGKSGAPAKSSGPEVFATEYGFAGVWHLGEDGNTADGGYLDATGNANHLTGSGMSADSDVEGPAGRAQRFDGVDDLLSGPSPSELNGGTSFTASFWMKFRINADSTRFWVLDFGTYGTMNQFHFLVWYDTTAQFGFHDEVEPPQSGKQNYFSLAGYFDAWVLATSTYDAQSKELSSYLNGRLMDRDTLHPVIALEASSVLSVGKGWRDSGLGYNNSHYLGALDEIRLSDVTRSEAWIRLSYENQKEGSTVVGIQ